MIKSFNLSQLLEIFARSYYIQPLMLLLGLTVCIYAIISKRKNRITRIISIYTTASVTQTAITFISWGYVDPSLPMLPILSFVYFLFIFIEAICCGYLILSVNLKISLAKIVKVALLGFLIFGAAYLLLTPSLKWNFNIVTMVELPLIILFCGIYYYHVLTHPAKAIVLQPQFWAISAMALLAFCLIPFSLVYDYISTSESLIYLIDIIPSFGYILSYILYIKAIQCSQKQPAL